MPNNFNILYLKKKLSNYLKNTFSKLLILIKFIVMHIFNFYFIKKIKNLYIHSISNFN